MLQFSNYLLQFHFASDCGRETINIPEFFPSGVPSLYMSFLENEEQPSEKITGQCFSTEMKATCKHSANLEQETKTTKIVNIIPCYDYLFL